MPRSDQLISGFDPVGCKDFFCIGAVERLPRLYGKQATVCGYLFADTRRVEIDQIDLCIGISGINALDAPFHADHDSAGHCGTLAKMAALEEQRKLTLWLAAWFIIVQTNWTVSV
jgi:hypothetical protein